MQPALFHCRHLAAATERSNFIDCAICVTERSVMGQMVEVPRGRSYGSEGVTNRNRTPVVTNN